MSWWNYLRGVAGVSGFGSATAAEQVSDKYAAVAKGKIIMITGANSGLGLETARALAKNGAHIVLPCRTLDKARKAADEIRTSSGNLDAQITPLQLDLSNMDSVRQCVQDFKKLGLPLHILINNAGVMAFPKRTLSEMGQEMQFTVNHLGHFLLTNLLLDDLKASGTAQEPSRVVILASTGHGLAPKKGGILFSDLTWEKNYQPFPAYGMTKLANILHARELQKRLNSEPNTHIVVNSLHPGVIKTPLGRHLPGFQQKFFGAMPQFPIFKTIPQGAATTVWAALAPQFKCKSEGGLYLSDCNLDKTNHPNAQDDETAKKLWQISEDLTAQ